MMTVEERASYQKYVESIVKCANDLTPDLPQGVRADLGFVSSNITGPHLAILIFSDVVPDVEIARLSVEKLLSQTELPTKRVSITVTDIDKIRKIYGDGVHGKLWNYGDPLKYCSLPKHR